MVLAREGFCTCGVYTALYGRRRVCPACAGWWRPYFMVIATITFFLLAALVPKVARAEDPAKAPTSAPVTAVLRAGDVAPFNGFLLARPRMEECFACLHAEQVRVDKLAQAPDPCPVWPYWVITLGGGFVAGIAAASIVWGTAR